jgi:O-antigen/teichoic acid export membrane protein
VYSNADFLVVGKVLGQAALGFYNIGWTLAMLIVERVTTIVGGVAPAYLSAARQNPAELRRYFARISGSIALLTFPVSFGLALVADDFCTVILGPKWAGAVAALRLLAVYAGVRSLTPIVPQILIVVGEHHFVALNAILAAIVMPIAFWIGAHWGLWGVAIAWVLMFPMITAPMFLRIFDVLKLTAVDYLHGIRLPLFSSVIMAAGVFLFRSVASEVIPALRLFLAVAVGALIYVGALYFIFGVRIAALVGVLRPRQSAA